MHVCSVRTGFAVSLLGLLALAFQAGPALARGGWMDPPGGWDYVYEAASGQDAFIDGDNVVGLLDGSWAQHTGTSYWDGSPPGVFNATNTDANGNLLPPAPGGVQVVCPEGELSEDGVDPLCYLVVEDVGNPTDAAAFMPPYVEPSNRKLYFYRAVNGNSETGWTIVARLRLSPAALDPRLNMAAGYNGANITDLPMVAVHDTGEGTVGFSLNDAGRLVVLNDGAANEVDVGLPTEWVTVWMTAVELPGTPEGRYNLKVYIDGSTTPALTLAGVTAPLSEITGSPDDWISIGSGRTNDDAGFQIDYVAFKSGAWEPGQTLPCPTSLGCSLNRAIGRTSVTLSWGLPPGAAFDGYDLKRGTELLAADLPGTTLTYYDLAPVSGLQTYELVAKSAAGSCSLTCQLATCLFGLQCAFRPGAVEGLVDCQLTWSNPGGIDGISVRRRLQRLNDLNEVDEELGTLAGSATDFLDAALASADLTRITYTVTATIGGTTCQLQCRPNTCPHDAACAVDRTGPAPAVDVTWLQDRAFDSITVNRRTDPALAFELKDTLPGTATSYVDTAVVEFGYYEYQIIGVQAGTAEPCGGTACDVFIAPVEAPYAPPAGGWAYLYDAETDGSDKYNPLAGESGNLDGNWIRSTVEDHWDGSKPGDTGPAPAGPVPGGIGLVRLPNADACKEAERGVLLLEDVGDPRILGYPDPTSNRKLFLGYDLGAADQNLLRNGVTLSFRMRLRPVPVDIPVEPGNAPWDGDGIGKGLGQVGVYFRNLGTPEAALLGASAGFAVAFDEAGANLSTSPGRQIAGVVVQEFHTFWVTIRDPEADDNYEVNVYLNGSTAPISASGPLQPPEPGVAANDPGFGPAVVNFLAIGLPNTGADASVEIDYVAFTPAVEIPVAQDCGEPPPPPTGRFRRADTDGSGVLDLTDAVGILGYLFLGAGTPACLDAADVDDSGVVELTDAIVSLGFQFLGGVPPAPPGASACGADVNPDTLADCVYDPTKC